jgi:hypothetical protein
MITLSFPLLVVAPAVCFALVMRRYGERFGTVPLAMILGVVFVAAFMAVQWPFATFLVYNPLAHGRLFNADNFVYWMPPRYEGLTRRFDPPAPRSLPFAMQVLIAMGIASVSAGYGLLRGRWMAKVRR